MLHPQGDLGRGCVRAGAPWAFSREPDLEPRSSGRVLRAGGAVERCAVVRGVSISLQRGRKPQAPLDSRGLADLVVVGVARSRTRQAPSEESALDPVPMEDLRQSSSQSRAFGVGADVAAGLGGLVAALVMDLGGDRDPPDSTAGC